MAVHEMGFTRRGRKYNSYMRSWALVHMKQKNWKMLFWYTLLLYVS